MESQSQLIEFLTDISLDPERLMGFLADPVAAMTAAKLPEDDIQALTSKNRHAVFARVAGIPFDEKDPLASHASALFNISSTTIVSTFE